MIAPQARGQVVPDAAGIPAFMEQVQRNLHLFGRYGITMFAISALDIALWDLAAQGEGRADTQADRRRQADADSGLCQPAADRQRRIWSRANAKRRVGLGYKAIKLHETTAPAVFAARKAIGRDIPLMVDMNCPLDRRGGDRVRTFLPRRRAAVPRRAGLAAGRFRDAGRSAQQGRAQRGRRRERLHGAAVQADDDGRRRQPCAAFRHQGRRHHRISEGRRRSPTNSASGWRRTRRISDRVCWRRCNCWRCATTQASSKCST